MKVYYIYFIFIWMSCSKKEPTPATEVVPTTNTTTASNTPDPTVIDSLTNETWVIHQYKDNSMLNPLPKQDTLIFIDQHNYTYNHIAGTYTLYNQTDQYIYHLLLRNTAFGDVSGTLPYNFRVQGEIINGPFTVQVVNGQTYYLWIKRI